MSYRLHHRQQHLIELYFWQVDEAYFRCCDVTDGSRISCNTDPDIQYVGASVQHHIGIVHSEVLEQSKATCRLDMSATKCPDVGGVVQLGELSLQWGSVQSAHYRRRSDARLILLRASGTVGISWGLEPGIQSIDYNIDDRLVPQPGLRNTAAGRYFSCGLDES